MLALACFQNRSLDTACCAHLELGAVLRLVSDVHHRFGLVELACGLLVLDLADRVEHLYVVHAALPLSAFDYDFNFALCCYLNLKFVFCRQFYPSLTGLRPNRRLNASVSFDKHPRRSVLLIASWAGLKLGQMASARL